MSDLYSDDGLGAEPGYVWEELKEMKKCMKKLLKKNKKLEKGRKKAEKKLEEALAQVEADKQSPGTMETLALMVVPKLCNKAVDVFVDSVTAPFKKN